MPKWLFIKAPKLQGKVCWVRKVNYEYSGDLNSKLLNSGFLLICCSVPDKYQGYSDGIWIAGKIVQYSPMPGNFHYSEHQLKNEPFVVYFDQRKHACACIRMVMFLIVFDHANACTSMCLLVEINNNHLTLRQMFLTWIPDKSAIQIPTTMVIEWFCYSNVCHLDPHCVPNLFKSVYHFICGDSWLSTGGRWNVELKRRLNVVINSRNSRNVQGDFHGGIIYRKKRFCLRVQTGCK